MTAWYKCFARVWNKVNLLVNLTAANSLNCVGVKHSFVMLVFQSILTTIVNLCIWPLVLIGGVENVLSSDQLWWPWGKGLNPPKKCFEFKCQPFPGFLAPLQINIDRCISKFASHHVHQEMGMGIVYATQDPKFGCCFWMILFISHSQEGPNFFYFNAPLS